MSALELVSAWIMALITAAAPPGRKIYYEEGQETKEEAIARYESITNDVITVVYDPSTKPLFQGPTGRARTAAVILSVMLHEGGFMRHVDYGLGKHARGDNGQSWCLMQLRIGNGRTMRWDTVHGRPAAPNDHSEGVFEGYTGEELIADRKVCIREGLKVLAISFGGTQGLPLEDRLRVYASGSREKGAEASHNRMNLAIKWFYQYPYKQVSDSEVVQELLELPSSQARTEKISLLAGPEVEGPES